MDCFLKKIFEGKAREEIEDPLIHVQFQKFSKGLFENKAMVMARKTKDKFSINTGPEYSNEFVRMLAEELGSEKALIKGPIISTKDLSNELDFQDKKQFMGIKQYIIDKEMSGDEIIELLDKLPLGHFGLSFKVGDTELKIKPKAPKSSKPSTKKEEKPKIDFCKLITLNTKMVKNILFDVENFKKIMIIHDFVIDDLILPKNEKDFAKIRELAKRKGKVLRKITIDDGQTQIKEAEFMA